MGGEEGKDHFQRALEAENQRAQVYLQGLEIGDATVQEKVSRVLNSLYSRVLRSKIFPENGYLTVVDDLTRCAIEGKPLRVFGALASPTAEREAEAYLSLHEALTGEGFDVNLGMLIVNWPYLSVANEYLGAEALTGVAVQSDIFQTQVEAVRKKLARLPSTLIHPWEITLARREKRTSMYPDTIMNAPREVQKTAALINPFSEGAEAEEAEESLNRLRQFYKKQRSLITYGPIQPEFDWIMRRAVSIWASGEAQKVRSPSFMATTELNASLLPFYGTPKQLPILNLNIPAV